MVGDTLNAVVEGTLDVLAHTDNNSQVVGIRPGRKMIEGANDVGKVGACAEQCVQEGADSLEGSGAGSLVRVVLVRGRFELQAGGVWVWERGNSWAGQGGQGRLQCPLGQKEQTVGTPMDLNAKENLA